MPRKKIPTKSMLKRTLTAAIAFPLFAFFIVIGGIYLKLVLAAVIIIGMKEFFGAVEKVNKPAHFAAYFFALLYMFSYDINPLYNPTTVVLILFVISLMAMLVFMHETMSVQNAATSVFGFCYVCILLSTIYLVRTGSYGQYFVWLIFISAWGSDTGAYFVGTFFGRHKMTPKLSPKKTYEGAVGGVVAATLLALLYGFSVQKLYPIADFNIVLGSALTGFAGSLFAMIGDLTASAIKRHNDVKDYGKILPGHGGILDRFDSILFTAPAVYLMMMVLRAIK